MVSETRIRRRARERALQFLFEIDLSGARWEEALPTFWEFHPSKPSVRKYADQLVEGTMVHLTEIDNRLADTVENWSIDRIAPVERNVLRIAAFEMMWRGDVPGRVIVNEAIDVAKKFSDTSSGKFVNGVLDRILHTVRPDEE